MLGLRGARADEALGRLRQRARPALEAPPPTRPWQGGRPRGVRIRPRVTSASPRAPPAQGTTPWQAFASRGGRGAGPSATRLWDREAPGPRPAVCPGTVGRARRWRWPRAPRRPQTVAPAVLCRGARLGAPGRQAGEGRGRARQRQRQHKPRAQWRLRRRDQPPGDLRWEDVLPTPPRWEARCPRAQDGAGGAAKRGPAGRRGLLRGGRCGRTLTVASRGTPGRSPGWLARGAGGAWLLRGRDAWGMTGGARRRSPRVGGAPPRGYPGRLGGPCAGRRPPGQAATGRGRGVGTSARGSPAGASARGAGRSANRVVAGACAQRWSAARHRGQDAAAPRAAREQRPVPLRRHSARRDSPCARRGARGGVLPLLPRPAPNASSAPSWRRGSSTARRHRPPRSGVGPGTAGATRVTRGTPGARKAWPGDGARGHGRPPARAQGHRALTRAATRHRLGSRTGTGTPGRAPRVAGGRDPSRLPHVAKGHDGLSARKRPRSGGAGRQGARGASPQAPSPRAPWCPKPPGAASAPPERCPLSTRRDRGGARGAALQGAALVRQRGLARHPRRQEPLLPPPRGRRRAAPSRGRATGRAAVRLARLQTRMLRWVAADAQRTRGRRTRSHPERVAALPSAQGTLRHRLRRVEPQGLSRMIRTPGGNTARVSLTAAGRQTARKLAGRDEAGRTREQQEVRSRSMAHRAWERCGHGTNAPSGSHDPGQGRGHACASPGPSHAPHRPQSNGILVAYHAGPVSAQPRMASPGKSMRIHEV